GSAWTTRRGSFVDAVDRPTRGPGEGRPASHGLFRPAWKLPSGARGCSLAHSVRKRILFARGGALGRRLEAELVTPVEPKQATAKPAAWSPGFLWMLLPSFLAALPVLLAIFGGPEVKQTRWDVVGVGVWFVLLILAEALPVPMIRGGTMTIASILDVGAILLFGPWVAGALDLITTLA